MIDLNAMEYLLAMWFVGGEEGDWLACVFKVPNDKRWHIQYRFRYYDGKQVGDPFKDEDRKSWYEGTCPDSPEDDQIAKTNAIASLVSLRYRSPVDRIEVRGAPGSLIEKAAGRPWFHYSAESLPASTTTRPASA